MREPDLRTSGKLSGAARCAPESESNPGFQILPHPCIADDFGRAWGLSSLCPSHVVHHARWQQKYMIEDVSPWHLLG